jgi:hypothetical protein
VTAGKWATMAHAAPGAIGVVVDRTTDWRLIVQAAAITTANVSGATQPAWVDVTAHLIDVEWEKGDAAVESRKPVGRAAFRFAAGIIVTVGAGDPLSNATAVNDRFGAGCLIRFGYRRTSDSSWRAMFTGVIDSIREPWSPHMPLRVLEVEAYDTSWYAAGYRLNATYGTLGTTSHAAFTQLLSAIDWPFGSGILTSLDPVIGGDPAQPAFNLLHRVADSAACQVFAANTGEMLMLDWKFTDPRSWWAVDAYVWVDAGAPYVFPSWAITVLPTFIEWTNSFDRMLYRTEANSTKVAGTTVGLATSPSLSARYGYRIDRSDWPKNDLLNSTYGAGAQAEVDATAERAQDPTRPATITFDTQTAPGTQLGSQKDLSTLLDFMSLMTELTRAYTVQRRTLGTAGWFNQQCVVGGYQGYITRDGNQHRMIVTHHLNWWS